MPLAPIEPSTHTVYSSETIALENPASFFPLVDALTDPCLPPPSSPERQMVEMNLALHAATPKLEAMFEWYRDTQSRSWEGGDVDVDKECGSWVDCGSQISGTSSSKPKPKILPFDHTHPKTLARPPHTAILYASPSSSNFRALHSYLYSLSSEVNPRVECILRWAPPASKDGVVAGERSYLSWYGVTLDLKKTDYLALDDRRSGSKSSSTESGGRAIDESSEEVVDFILELMESYPVPENYTWDSSHPLAEDELLAIGIQATQLITSSTNPLTTLTKLTQNFPSYASLLARRVVVGEELDQEIRNNHVGKVQGGINAVWLNGGVVGEGEVNPFGLLRLLYRERPLVLSLTSEPLSLTRRQAITLLTHPTIAAAQGEEGGVLEGLFDASDRQEGGGVVVWWNDLRKDSRYKKWSESLEVLLRPSYPGTFPQTKHHLFNIVAVLDLSKTSSINFLTQAVSGIIQRGFGFRWGVAPVLSNNEGQKMGRLFHYMIENFGRAKTMGFFKKVSQIQTLTDQTATSINWPFIRSEYDTLVLAQSESENFVPRDLDSVVGDGEKEEELAKASAYAKRLAVDGSGSGESGHVFVNGKPFDMDDDFLRSMQTEIGQQLQFLQAMVMYTGAVTDTDDDAIDNYFYDRPTTAPKRNNPGRGLKIMDLGKVFGRDDGMEGGRFVILTPESLARIGFIRNPRNASPPSHHIDQMHSSLMPHVLSNPFLYKLSSSRLLRVLGLSSHIATPNSGPPNGYHE
ncbi:hypothetical protein JAAARDRAFT_198531 [Jaapia argillacea MUCL 33604]|uniref:UGGT thioredoxin-like domain-containing protein n=1 Tax=Jaapia argillacea MUCL 33604 TaxID=933084 RepID=A0A067PM13_9AGAM|nr:hypothetical protein JAAARDRAFT_198531 [Jaapia argillacea MUCL 33604]